MGTSLQSYYMVTVVFRGYEHVILKERLLLTTLAFGVHVVLYLKVWVLISG